MVFGRCYDGKVFNFFGIGMLFLVLVLVFLILVYLVVGILVGLFYE